MPAAKQNQRRTASRPASRGRTSSNGSGASSGSRPASGSASRGSSSRSASRSKTSSRSSGARSQARKSQPRKSQARNGGGQRTQAPGGAQQTSANGSRSESAKGTLVNVGVSALSAAVGLAGGLALGRAALQRNRKVLGVSVPSKIDLSGVGQQLGEAGRQFGKLASEVRAVREKAEQIGKVLT
jgi:hypothetical protein